MTVTEGLAASELSGRLDELHRLAARDMTSGTDLAAALSTMQRAIFDTDLAPYSPSSLKAAAHPLRRQLFGLRTMLRTRIPDWHAAGLIDHKVQLLLRDCLRASRFASDMLGELAYGFRQSPSGQEPLKAFTNAAYTMLPPAFDNADAATFQPGDILLVRGLHHNSAAIARIGDVDSQFSHVAIIHVDKQGRQWAVESLIEEGAVIRPLGKTLAHGNGRALLLRHPDRELAERAGRIAYEHVRRSYGTLKKRIPYDFSMQLDRRRPLFCSKLIRLAYDQASRGTLKLPTFRTRFDLKNRDFIDRIGVTAVDTFAPGDIEIEPGFEMIAEWQDLRVTSRLRAQDLIMVKLFEWMDRHGYIFDEDALVRIISRFGRMSAYLSDGVKSLLADVVPKVPINMPRKTVAAVVMLHKTAEPLLQEILLIEANHIRRTGLPLHPSSVLAALEQMRERADGRIGYLVLPRA